MHTTIDPAILYVGTPVVLISTENPDGSPNLAPMSSAWWLGHRCMLGLASGSHTTANLGRTGECVLNLPSDDLVGHVDRIARTTGSDPVPEHKRARGYRHVREKFAEAGLTADPSEVVRPPRVRECPLQLEATLVEDRGFGPAARARALEVRVERIHADEDVVAGGDRIDPARWRPLIMSFQRFWGLADHEAGPSDLARIPERLYR